ncbi:uncharacterized protein UTRI_05026 [Ustilago trichophora]|uniref:Uncharacterized protein n=1 Tax=Ustilago trichophora TaxID=86804 RepID=A0A5C3EB49_9BASI|nr:uncharacterized protein UTRI_05026 [Ustilago trichophora]
MRVDAVPAAQRCTYHVNYCVAIKHHSSQRLRFSSYSHAGGVNLSQLDKIYYSRCNITKSFRASSIPSFLRKKTQQYLIENVGWSFLRGAGNRQILSLLQKNSNKTCRAVFDRAMSFLLLHASQLNDIQGMDEKLVTVVMEGCMRILCDLQGVGVREASAVVAAWAPVGIFMSDELVKNLLGAEVKCENTWELWNLFYKEALIALKKGRFRSGREMEKVAWSMMHPATETAPIESVAPAEIKPEGSPVVLTSAAAKTSLGTAAPISSFQTAKETHPCLYMLQKKSKKQRKREAKEQKAKERERKIKVSSRAASISTVAMASRSLNQQIVLTSGATTNKSHKQNKKLGKKEKKEQGLENNIKYKSGADIEVITISDDESDQPITTARCEISKKQSNKRKRSSDSFAPSPAYSEFSTTSDGCSSSSSTSSVSLGTPQWWYEAEKKQSKMLKERRKRRKSTADWIEEAKKAAAERNEDADGRRRSKRIKALREQA